MGTVTEAINQDLDELTTKAITSLKRASEDLVSWVDLVRDPESRGLQSGSLAGSGGECFCRSCSVGTQATGLGRRSGELAT